MSIIDFLYGLYISYTPVSTGIMLEKYRAVAMAVFELIKERDEAKGIKTKAVWDEKVGFPYNDDLEKVLNLLSELESTYGDEAFRTGFEAGARMTFEIMEKICD